MDLPELRLILRPIGFVLVVAIVLNVIYREAAKINALNGPAINLNAFTGLFKSIMELLGPSPTKIALSIIAIVVGVNYFHDPW